MKKTLKAVAFAAGLTLSTASMAAIFTESEPNNTIATADFVDGYFSLDYSADIGDTASNTSTTIPHVTINATAESGGYDVFGFTVTTAGSRGIFDIDYALGDEPGGFDAYLRLFNALGTSLSADDDSSTSVGQGGSVHSYDSYLEYVFATPGTYFIRVGACCEGGFYGNTGYQLQLSLENGVTEVPEPAALGLLGMGALAIAAGRRRKTA